MRGGEERLLNFISVDHLIKELGLDERTVPPIAMKYIRKMMARDPDARCSLSDMFHDPAIFDMVVRMGLDNLLEDDRPRVMVVSPSMEDFDASVPLPLLPPSDPGPSSAPIARDRTITPKIAVGLATFAPRFRSPISLCAHTLLVSAIIKWNTDDETELLILLSVLEMILGIADFSIPLVVFFGYTFYVITDRFTSYRLPRPKPNASNK
jgi:hypothetical protein